MGTSCLTARLGGRGDKILQGSAGDRGWHLKAPSGLLVVNEHKKLYVTAVRYDKKQIDEKRQIHVNCSLLKDC